MRLVCINEKVLLVQELTAVGVTGMAYVDVKLVKKVLLMPCLSFKFGKGRIFQNLSQCENKRNICMSVVIIFSLFNATYVGTVRCS